jgi:hypothetical protein
MYGLKPVPFKLTHYRSFDYEKKPMVANALPASNFRVLRLAGTDRRARGRNG